MKNTVMGIFGIAGGFVISLLGGRSNVLAALIVFMAVDYLTGVIAAGVFKKSPKTKTGALNSAVGFKGIFKKICILFVVMMAYRLDVIANTGFVKNSVIVAYIANEFLSITENLALMGVYMPSAVKRAIDVIQKGDKERKNEDSD